ncbi:hypothetical protein [Kocuria sp. CNJ-770]|uniref:hypothetical protein n=1 Tax=Kocuria sp. CNJ-770 TaxID=1904964 RepID=UPI0021014C72|nr:hypothetical protein [Kocuria sp. CNJ-770]
MPPPDEITVPTETGPGRLLVSRASSPAGSPWAVLWLGHGAGGGAGSRDLAALAAGLPRHGVTVVRHEQPWVVAGKRIAPRPAALDAAWLAAAPAVAELAGATPWSSAAAAPGPAWRAARPGRWGPRPCCAWPSRCTRRDGRSGPGPRSC